MSKTKQSLMSKLIRLQLKSRAPKPVNWLSFTSTLETVWMLENLCLILIPTSRNQLDQPNKLKNKNLNSKSRMNKLKSKNLKLKRKNNPNNKNQLKQNRPRNQNQHQKSKLEPYLKENKPENPCPDSETESLNDSKKPKTITHSSQLSKKLTC